MSETNSAKLCVSTEWLPIATAPKDREILICDEKGFMFVASWREGFGEAPYWGSNACIDGYFGTRDPTHWMPLPPAPETDNGK